LGTIGFLMVFPLVVAGVLLVVRNDGARGIIVGVASLAIAVASIVLAASYLTGGTHYFHFESEAGSIIALVVDVAIGLYAIAVSVKYRKYLVTALALVQTVLVTWFELGPARSIEAGFNVYTDTLSIIMVLIIGIVGSGICLYAVGYMRDFAAHSKDVPDRRPVFFAVMFAFLSGMFAVVLANNLAWLFCGWEITTICSFLLIGYTKTAEATKNAFLQLVMNLAGGLAFAIAMAWVGVKYDTIELSTLIDLGLTGAAVAVPVLLIAIAGLVKAAQMPTHSWLLGAMVAPTPTSALLHSSTMVKAGVFILIKLSPLMGVGTALGFNAVGWTVMLVGGVTFMLASMMAITQTNAKRVLAYSTVANLGLITACAGIGTAEAIWAAIFLIIFHAVAKALLFQCVGTAEHHIGSRDIEDMDALFVRMPILARLMALGMAGMFIAPFGMLVSKWGALAAFVDSDNIVLVFLLIYGSAATFFFWAKWLGKVSAVAGAKSDLEKTVSASEWGANGIMAALTVGVALFFPVVSSEAVVPYLGEMFRRVSVAITTDNLYLMTAVTAFLILVLAPALVRRRASERDLPVYMAGVGTSEEESAFYGPMHTVTVASQRNWYMRDWFGEEKLGRWGVVVSLVILVVGLILAAFSGGMAN